MDDPTFIQYTNHENSIYTGPLLWHLYANIGHIT